ncbi:hypothetical protein SHKM778_74560 [Streptomyces sp. KM77-8]|uniref:HTH tetR-type domain-containing protein n=1 Tax=Streptomyces haneummycinicus TaxID=3074435 RepID=A0AAT9HU79_9ACTN
MIVRSIRIYRQVGALAAVDQVIHATADGMPCCLIIHPHRLSRTGPMPTEAGTTRTTGPASPLTERQEARRRRILRASAQLAGRGGFDAVQMREVAESSQVALGTLYRYFLQDPSAGRHHAGPAGDPARHAPQEAPGR